MNEKSKKIKNKSLRVRVTQDELNQVKLNAGDLTVSDFLRSLALKQPMPKPKEPKKEPSYKPIIHVVEPDFAIAVNRIGVNINQIARHLNSDNELDQKILLTLITIQSTLDNAVNEILKK